MGLRKIHRLKHWRDFRSVYKKGSSCHSPHLILRALSTAKKDRKSATNPSRIGISISTKVSKRAVKRNLLKRQLRGAIAKFLPRMATGWDLVIIVKPSAIECKYEHFLRELEQLLKETKIINGH